MGSPHRLLSQMMRTQPAPGGPPPQDQCMLPDFAAQEMVDQVTSTGYAVGSNYSITNTPELAFVATGHHSAPVLSASDSGLPMKDHSGSFTILARAYGIGSNSQAGSLLGDLGAAPDRGTMWGPRSDGGSGLYIAINSNDIVGFVAPGMWVNDGVYHDYAAIFESGTRLTQYKDGVLEDEITAGIPVGRFTGSSLPVRIANRGDRQDGGGSASYLSGRVQFVFWYNRVLSDAEMAAAFADGGYVPQ